MEDSMTTDEPVSPDSALTPSPAAAVEDDDAPLGEAGQKAYYAEKERRRKLAASLDAANAKLRELEAAQAKLREYEDRDKTEAERLAARLAEAEQEAQSARSEALRLRIASETGVPADLLEFITGTDEETARQQAEKLMAATKPAGQAAVMKPDPTQGAKPNGSIGQLTRADLASMTPDEINKALTEGRLSDLLAGRT